MQGFFTLNYHLAGWK